MSLVYFQIVDLLTPLVGTSLGFVPNILNTDVYDEIIQIADDEAVDTFKQLASQKGLSAASVFQVAKQLRAGKAGAVHCSRYKRALFKHESILRRSVKGLDLMKTT